MKKTLLISVAILVIGLAIAIPVVTKNRKPIPDSSKQITSQDNTSERYIANIKEYTGSLPMFTLKLSGKFDTTITNESIDSNIKMYEFDASIADMYGIHKNKYVGFRYGDLLKTLNASSYNSAKFISNRKTLSFREKELDLSKTYIVFSRK